MAGTEAVLQRNALPLAALADALDDQLLGHRAGQFRAVVAAEHGEQQVEHGEPATGGQTVAIPVEQVAGDDSLGEALGEIVLPAPVHGDPVAVEQAQLRQRVDPRRQSAEHAAGAGRLLERIAEHRRQRGRRLVGDQEQLLAAVQLAHPGLAGQSPVALARRLGLQEQQLVGDFRVQALGGA
ncbi:hypothetical protein FQZ97_911570 [compost metagenome]